MFALNALLFFLASAVTMQFVSCEDFKFLLLHNNDMHGRFEETSIKSGTCKDSDRNKNCIGGMARTAHMVRHFRNLAQEGRGPPTIFLNAGDTYVGTVWFTIFKWKICRDFINVLRPDVLSLGNHEFDNGVEGLAPFVEGVRSPIVAANLDFRNEPSLSRISKSHVLNVNGHKIGVIGYLTPETKQISQTEGTIFNDEVEAITQESERLDSMGVKIIIALGHAGYLIDQKIAKEVPLVDVVVGGHTNTFLWNGAQPSVEKVEDPYPKVVVQESGKKVPVVQAYAYTKYLGQLNLTFNEHGDLVDFAGQPILLGSHIPQDSDVLELLDRYRPQIEKINTKVIGKSKVVLDGSANICRFEECNFGNFIADSMVYYVASVTASGKYWTHAPIGLMNGGGIRNSINPYIMSGNITRGEILGALPFGNQIITLTLTGQDLINTLEIGVRSNGETSSGEFIQVSGLHVVLDRRRPPLSRVVSVKVRCSECEVPTYENIDPKKNYTVVTTSFLYQGGDGHTVLRDKGMNAFTEDFDDVEVIVWYLSKNSPVFPEIQERIKLLTNDNENEVNFSSRSIPSSLLVIISMVITLSKLILV